MHTSRTSLHGDIEFEPYLLTKDGDLFCPNGARIQLPNRLRCILFEIAAKNGATVSRADLIERFWPDESIGEDSLTRAIADLRKIFRANGGNCIETVYSLGYRLNTGQPVQEIREAIAICQEARQRVNQRLKFTLDSAEDLFSKVVEKDKTYIPAWLGLAEAQIHRMQAGYAPTMESAQQDWLFLDRVLDLDPNCADALALKGILLTWADWDFAAAEATLKRACDLDPNAYLPNQTTAWHKLALGKLKSAERHAKAAIAARPMSATAQTIWAYSLMQKGDHQTALSVAREMARKDSRGAVSLGLAAMFEAALGSAAEAVAMAKYSFELLPYSPVAGAILAYALARDGLLENAWTLLESETSDELPIGLNTMASPAWVELGENDLALAALESGFETRCTWLLPMLNDPRVACLNCEQLKASIFK